MTEKLVKVIDPIGLHARPAAILVAIASKYSANNIKIILDDERVADAKSILNVLSFAIKAEQEFKIKVDGNNSEEVMQELIQSLSSQDIILEI